MTKKKIQQIKSVALYSAIGLLAVSAIVLGVAAQYQAAKVVNVAGDYIEAPLPEGAIIEETLGGAFSTSWTDQNGLITQVMAQDAADATNTLFWMPNPFGSPSSTDARYNAANPYTLRYNATTTVDLAVIEITGVSTSTIKHLTCGAAITAYGDPVYKLLETDGDALTTNTPATIQNGTTTGQAIIDGTEGLTSKIALTPEYPYFVCKANIDDVRIAKGFTGDTNTFAAKIKVRFSWVQ